MTTLRVLSRRPIIHVESPLRPQPGDPHWSHTTGTHATAGEVGLAKRLAFEANLQYVKDVCRMIALAGGVPQAPHLFFPLFLDDFKEDERENGLEAGIQLQRLADEVWFTLPDWRTELSEGMRQGMQRALKLEPPLPCVMAQSSGGPHTVGDATFPSKLHYHLNRLVSGNIDLRRVEAHGA